MNYPPAQNRYMQEKILEELIFARECMWGLYSHECEYRLQFFRGIIFEICIRTLAPALCIDIVPVFAHLWCQYIKIFWGN